MGRTKRPKGSPPLPMLTEEQIELKIIILQYAFAAAWDFAGSNNENRGPFWDKARKAPKSGTDPLGLYFGPGSMFREGRTIACNGGSAAVIIKAVIAAALLKAGIREVSPGTLPNTELIRAIRQAIRDYYSDKSNQFFEKQRNEKGFKEGDLLPGDQVWFYNPYYKEHFTGEQGSNVFYIGDGKVIELYPHGGGHRIYTIKEYQRHIIESFDSVPRGAKPEEFPIVTRARPIFFRP